MSDLNFIPKILLCGDEAEFLSRVGQRPFKIVGRLPIAGKVDWGGGEYNLRLNVELKELSALKDFLASGKADYLVFTDSREYLKFVAAAENFPDKLLTIEQFKKLPLGFFYDVDSERKIISHMNALKIRTLLDVDGYFSCGKLFTKLDNAVTQIDCVVDKPLLPIMENIYSHVYKNLAEVGFKHYDAVLAAEREPAAFDDVFTLTENLSDMIITFARKNSDLERHLAEKDFAKKEFIETGTGTWHFLTRRKPPIDFAVYVVTHKPTPHDGKLPDGYKIIHAGRALNEDLGYLGDNTGDNISRLNLYINEITALYWLWKNTAHTVIGLCHYRRFFTTAEDLTFAYEKILTKEDALKLLERYDIIVSTIGFEMMPQRELIRNDCGVELTTFAESVIRKHLLKAQPDYLESFETVMNLVAIYKCNMFVARRDVFDAWCKWLFSFYIDATEEVLRTFNLDEITDNRRRILGYFSERLLTIWLWKNRLRIKELDFMFISGI